MNRDCLKVYAVTDRSWLNGESLASQVEKALRGGAGFVQLREKNLDQDQFLAEAMELRALCKRYQVPFVINDSVEIARLCDADGVHVGQEDMALTEARKVLGADKIIGVTCKTVEEALKAETDGADYIGSGAMFQSTAKPGAEPITFETLREICSAVSIPVVAIGGITQENVFQLRDTGIAGVAVVSAIFQQKDIEAATRTLYQTVAQLF